MTDKEIIRTDKFLSLMLRHSASGFWLLDRVAADSTEIHP